MIDTIKVGDRRRFINIDDDSFRGLPFTVVNIGYNSPDKGVTYNGYVYYQYDGSCRTTNWPIDATDEQDGFLECTEPIMEEETVPAKTTFVVQGPKKPVFTVMKEVTVEPGDNGNDYSVLLLELPTIEEVRSLRTALQVFIDAYDPEV